MTTRCTIPLLALALAAGCAGAPRAQTAPETSDVAAGAAAESTTSVSPIFPGPDAPTLEDVLVAENDLATALDAGASCDLVASLRDRICGLAQRICALSSESPEDATMRAQCEDGANRCLAATEGVRNRCGP